jgi:hypothetical protein
MNEELLEKYKTVERIIAFQERTLGAGEYLIKWNGLPYSEWFVNINYFHGNTLYCLLFIFRYPIFSVIL